MRPCDGVTEGRWSGVLGSSLVLVPVREWFLVGRVVDLVHDA
jgi:hypothetical protein